MAVQQGKIDRLKGMLDTGVDRQGRQISAGRMAVLANRLKGLMLPPPGPAWWTPEMAAAWQAPVYRTPGVRPEWRELYEQYLRRAGGGV